MDEQIADLYRLPNLSEYEDIHLLTLREHCAVLESQVEVLLTRLSDRDRYVLEAYMDIRNTLEFETVKVALRWGKEHYK